MVEVRQARQFPEWFMGLRDTRARARITVRIDRLAFQNSGQDFGMAVIKAASVAVLPLPKH